MSQTFEGSTQSATGQVIPGPRASAEARPESVAAAAPAPAPPGDPALIGLPAFLVGAVALALVQVGFVPATATASAVPIIMTATAVGQVIAAVWSARLGQSVAAGMHGIFAGFWLSYSALVLGLTHNWFGIAPQGVARAQETFLIAWVVVIALLTLGTLRLPATYTALFALVELAFVLALISTINGSTALAKAGGYAVFAFVVVGAYLFMSAMSEATGGRPYAVGRPIIR